MNRTLMNRTLMNRTVYIALLALCATGLTGCTFMGLDDIALPQCQSDQDCNDAFNEAEGLYTECHAYACVPDGDRRTCQRIEGEICDGFDNDCDHLVDESDGASQVFAPAVTMRVDTAGDVSGDLNVSSDSDQRVLASWSRLSGSSYEGWTARLDSAMPTAQQLGYRTNLNTNLASTTLTAAGAPGTCGALGLEPRNCEMGDVVRASGRYGTFTATLNVDGCPAGLLRITETAPDVPTELVDRGPGRRSSIYRGVARVEGTACSENLSDACQAAITSGTGISTVCGVTLPSIAAIPTDPPQALVTFVGAPDGTPTCGGDMAPVEIIGAYRRGSVSSGIEWVDGVNEGVPESIGSTKGGGRPGVLAVGTAGFLVGFGDENGKLALRFVEAAGTPPVNSGLVPCTGAGCEEDRSGVETPAHGTVAPFEAIGSVSGGQVDDVQLSLGRVTGAMIEVGVSYREGCTPTGSQLIFRRVTIDISGSPARLVSAGSPSRLDAERQIQGASALIHVGEGFVAEGFARDGQSATSADLGGFFVAWPSNRHELIARRVSDLDARPLFSNDRADLLLLSQTPTGDGAMTPTVRSAAMFINHDGANFAYYDRANSDVAAGRLVCASGG